MLFQFARSEIVRKSTKFCLSVDEGIRGNKSDLPEANVNRVNHCHVDLDVSSIIGQAIFKGAVRYNGEDLNPLLHW